MTGRRSRATTQGRWPALVLAIVTAAATLIPLAVHASVAEASTPPNAHISGSFSSQGLMYSYRAYVPATRPAHPALVVVVHGCGTTAAQQEAAIAMDPIARKSGFIVLYVDGSLLNTAQLFCWRALDLPNGETRTSGDAAAIAGMTRMMAGRYGVDARRVYAIGMSSGAFETSMLGALFPQLYAAIGIHSGGAYARGAIGCVGTYLPTSSTATLAARAFSTEGNARRVIPVIAFHGDSDHTVPYQCGQQAVDQWRQTDNAVLSAEGRSARILASPTAVTSAVAQRGEGHRYTVRSWRLAGQHCTVQQFWTVHGMDHYWSGGSSAPASARFTDPSGPNAAAAAWHFFSQIQRTRVGYRCS